MRDHIMKYVIKLPRMSLAYTQPGWFISNSYIFYNFNTVKHASTVEDSNKGDL